MCFSVWVGEKWEGKRANVSIEEESSGLITTQSYQDEGRNSEKYEKYEVHQEVPQYSGHQHADKDFSSLVLMKADFF